ncbi:hypothetical protein Q5P01_002624 [Channa striata]|uniref:Uncharacterized protein n=1 Tax=Channa striata TaxID=64152 RepID=A0AA88NMV7_CHASR|nr:hypothetical protein Q5P01_002624 [Channa striata]
MDTLDDEEEEERRVSCALIGSFGFTFTGHGAQADPARRAAGERQRSGVIKSLQVRLCQHLPSLLGSQLLQAGRGRNIKQSGAVQQHFLRLAHPGQLSSKDRSSVLLGV